MLLQNLYWILYDQHITSLTVTAELSGYDSYDRFRDSHKEFVEELLKDGVNFRQSEWTESIAVGSGILYRGPLSLRHTDTLPI